MAGNQSATIARFGDFELDLSTRELRKLGTRLRLEDKPSQLLCLLVESAPKLLSREELKATLWPAGVHLDRDHGLNKCINRLRFVLADDSTQPRFIETLSRRGYRFVGEVEFVRVASVAATGGAIQKEIRAANRDAGGDPASVAEPLTTEPPPWPVGGSGRARLSWAALGVLVLLGAGLAYTRMHPSGGKGVGEAASGSAMGRPANGALSAVVVETGGGLDPEDSGFQVHALGNFQRKPYRNNAGQGFDRLLITSEDQGYFFRPFTTEEKKFALQRNWKLTCTCAVKEGYAFADVDFGKNWGPARFDLGLLQEGDRNYVVLTQQISPVLLFEKKVEFAGAGDLAHLHTFELRYDHASQTASLWIDGTLAASGYHGVQQFREDRGVMFGSAVFLRATQGAGLFGTVRFEAR